ncbi:MULTISPECIES: DUF484 family protein [Thiorhodovibrio]|uniref:DUF484 family protein n=1 Tax=Thiorhodovibrio TaxID=61593 RepID=UPI00191381FF|nr:MULTISPECIES: DUF484 family protein [Thiorhodovibrio]MBK5968271.1 hypothetical protein [Thiorhodovibrio winogradskyi]WPL13025.1 hypothetical protein Thiosp_02810 [Thiorhodovibrio litoralis]
MTRHSAPDNAITEAMAVAYLDEHPDLLLRHPQLLIKLEIPHGGDGTVSLVERQLNLLREQIAQERQRLACLVERAREYESLSAHLHELTTKIILARSVKHVQDILDVELKIEFEAEAVALLQFPLPDQEADSPSLPEPLAKLSELDHCQCGQLKTDQYDEIFGSKAEALLSAALIPLKGPKMRGLLAIASRDPDHFTADMGTDALERLADIISAKLIELALLHHD